jgi:hypothetical protein
MMPELEVLLKIKTDLMHIFIFSFERVIIVTKRLAGVGLCSFIGTRRWYLSKRLLFQIMTWSFNLKLKIDNNNTFKTIKCALMKKN